jgi:hypothetical protein
MCGRLARLPAGTEICSVLAIRDARRGETGVLEVTELRAGKPPLLHALGPVDGKGG